MTPEAFLSDLRFAVRMLLKNPGVFLAAALSLALGNGANATIFSWVKAVLLEPFAGVPSQHELVTVATRVRNADYVSLSYPDYRDFRDQTGSFEGLAASQLAVFSLGADRHGERAERLFGAVVSGNYFSVLGVTAAQGRTFATDEDSVPGAAPVAVLSDSLWRGRFAGDPLMIGRSISLNGHPITVIGIAPPEFQGTTVGIATALWVPMSMEPQLLAGRSRLELRGIRWVHGLARLKPGVSTDQAEAELRTISERLARDYPTSNDGYHATVMPLWRSPWGAQQLLGPVLLVLMALEPG